MLTTQVDIISESDDPRGKSEQNGFTVVVITEVERIDEMTRQSITSQSQAIFIGFVVLVCVFLATTFWLTAISFVLEAGDQRIQIQDPVLKRAANFATLGFVILEIAATWALMRLPLGASSTRIRPGVKAVVVFVALCFASHAMTLAAVWGFAPDPLVDTSRIVGAWIIRILG